jgi:glucose/arabinose dehydrogenase
MLVYLTHAGDGSGRAFLVEKQGRVMILRDGVVNPTPFLDIRDRVNMDGMEQGLLSIAFAPDFRESGRFYVNYTGGNGSGQTVVSRFTAIPGADRTTALTEQILLRIDQPAINHNGGQIAFGPDGFLYVGMGDGGRANDPWDNAETLSVRLGKLLRIDVASEGGYTVPPSNPYAGHAANAPEIWASGLRNPWRFSFDRETGDLYIADVGQNEWEEVDFQPAGSHGGEHYGWDTLEAFACHEPESDCEPAGTVLPATAYDHSLGCSITGGYVYRGASYPSLQGVYLYGDYCSGRIWGLQRSETGEWETALLLESGVNIASFGEDEAGEVYVIALDGRVFQIEARPSD